MVIVHFAIGIHELPFYKVMVVITAPLVSFCAADTVHSHVPHTSVHIRLNNTGTDTCMCFLEVLWTWCGPIRCVGLVTGFL